MEQETRVQVYTLTGTQVWEQVVAPNERINVAAWRKGTYLAKINGANATKLVVK